VRGERAQEIADLQILGFKKLKKYACPPFQTAKCLGILSLWDNKFSEYCSFSSTVLVNSLFALAGVWPLMCSMFAWQRYTFATSFLSAVHQQLINVASSRKFGLLPPVGNAYRQLCDRNRPDLSEGSGKKGPSLKGLSYEIDFENVDEKWQILALIRAAAGSWIFRRYLWFFVEIKHLLSGKC